MARTAVAAAIAASAAAALGLLAATSNGSSATNTAPAAALVAASTAAAPVTYDIDPVHSGVLFRIRHAGVAPFYGRFNEVSGTFTFDPDNPSAARFNAAIPINSIDTNSKKRDDHLKAADFFNARQFPGATFNASSASATDKPGHYKVTGELNMHGVTRTVTADMHWIGTGNFQGADVAGFEAVIEIKRADFGMTTYLAPDGSESGGLGNTVKIIIAVEGRAQ